MTMTQGRLQRREDRPARRVQAADRVKSGAAQRAYAKRRNREQDRAGSPTLPRGGEPVLAGRIPFVASIIALLGCGLALTLLLTTRAAEDSYQLGDARAVNTQLSDERAALQRQVEAADSAPELAARARELGMIPARDPARLVIAPDGSVTVVGTPAPAQGSPAPPLNTTPPAPGATPPKLVQAQGERVVPVTTTPNAPQPPANQAPANQNPAVLAAPQTTAPAPQPAAPQQATTPQPYPVAPVQDPAAQQPAPADPAPAPVTQPEPNPAAPVAPQPVQATPAPVMPGVPE
ncbi:hypothetical protein [Nocardia sp. NPDC050406]|uniref:hypothetical protein n=1 Tax=Nocardia sp. NPDC050406 TaxID=3364318 RepID=UPI0037ADB566